LQPDRGTRDNWLSCEFSRSKAAQSGTLGIAEWANQTLPALEDDLKAAQKIAPAVGVHATAKTEEQGSPKPSKPASPGSQQY
jgi:hypothetical protein